MKNLTTEERNAILSARAKNRKAATALIEAGVVLPKAKANAMKALDEYLTGLIEGAAKKAA